MPGGSKRCSWASVASTRATSQSRRLATSARSPLQISGIVDHIDEMRADDAVDRVGDVDRELRQKMVAQSQRPARASGRGRAGRRRHSAPMMSPMCARRPDRRRGRGCLRPRSPAASRQRSTSSLIRLAAVGRLFGSRASPPAPSRRGVRRAPRSGFCSSSVSTKADSSRFESCSSLIACCSCGVMTSACVCRRSSLCESAMPTLITRIESWLQISGQVVDGP